jgi:hypothetical protein
LFKNLGLQGEKIETVLILNPSRPLEAKVFNVRLAA